ncbi:aspartyl protease family protein [Roseivirga sp. BDSF3-8]|uniref:aspartyl protease family protein n=1 Tax=Roseivirga sp. BDSF3-8 TaxID=3241598 RepID=UPI0035321639
MAKRPRIRFLTKVAIMATSLMLCVLQVYPQSPGLRFVTPRKKLTLPFEMYNNLIVVPILLNNQIPLKFIVDTGVKTTILTDKAYSDLLNVDYSRKLTIAGLGRNSQVEAYVANNLTVSMPGVVGTGQAFLVLEEDYLQLRKNLGAVVHGIIGFELFRRFVVKIDYQNRELTLYDPTRFSPPRRYKEIDIMLDSYKPLVYADLKTRDTTVNNQRYLIDTGASLSLMIKKDSFSGVNVPEKNVERLIGQGLGGQLHGHVGRVEEIDWDGYRLKEPIASFPEPDPGAEVVFFRDREGTIGGEILSRFTVIMDYHNRKMYLKKNRKFRDPFEFNMAGFDIMADGVNLDKFYVSEVIANTPAQEAGIKRGDRIMRLNGRQAYNYELREIIEIITRKPGKKIKMELMRSDGSKYRVKFRLERIL